MINMYLCHRKKHYYSAFETKPQHVSSFLSNWPEEFGFALIDCVGLVAPCTLQRATRHSAQIYAFVIIVHLYKYMVLKLSKIWVLKL